MFKKYRSTKGALIGGNITRHYIRNMTQSSQLLKSNEIAGLFVIQPLLIGKLVKSDGEKMQMKNLRTQDRLFWKNTYSLFSESLKSIPEKETVWKNLQGLFDKVQQDIFVDTLHVNDQGQKILADELSQIIYDNFLSKTQK